jgi:hypothetical protein
MKFRIAIATFGASLAFAGVAHAAVGPMNDVVVTGPSGVTWTGSCPGTISEQDVGKLDETCRSLGYRMPIDAVHTLAALGGTKATWSRDGHVVTVGEVVDGAYKRTFAELGLEISCPIVNDTVDMASCSRSDRARAAKRRAKHRR